MLHNNKYRQLITLSLSLSLTPSRLCFFCLLFFFSCCYCIKCVSCVSVNSHKHIYIYVYIHRHLTNIFTIWMYYNDKNNTIFNNVSDYILFFCTHCSNRHCGTITSPTTTQEQKIIFCFDDNDFICVLHQHL